MAMADNRATTGKVTEHRVDIGAQVGIERNTAFASGGRTRRITPMAYRSWRPLYEVAGGQVLIQLSGPSLLNR